MPDVRPLNEKKYNISKNRFREIYYHCLQYQEWKSELKYLTDTRKSTEYGKEGKGSAPQGSETEKLAIHRIELEKKCELIEQTAIEADADIYQFVIEGVTTNYASFRYLHDAKGMPCGEQKYYRARRKFYYLMSRKL